MRKSLLHTGGFSRYLLYALGEIALVVIGILIALQVNNWNEARINDIKGKSFLRGIHTDLQEDSIILEMLLEDYAENISIAESIQKSYDNFMQREGLSIFSDDVIKTGFSHIKANKVNVSDTIYLKSFCSRQRSFRPSVGTFNALIADGNSELIKNRDLFNDLQQLYLVESENLKSIYETIKTAEDNFNWKYSTMFAFTPNQAPKDIQDKEFIADLIYFYEPINLYYLVLYNTRKMIHGLLESIRRELIDLPTDS